MKNKILSIVMVMFLGMFAFIPNVFADVCGNVLPDVVIDDSIPNAVSLIIKVIQIAVPILLVVMGSIDLIKGLAAQKEDEIKKGQQIFVKRLIAGVLVFFIIAIVKLLISAVSSDSSDIMSCACYFFNGANSSSCTG